MGVKWSCIVFTLKNGLTIIKYTAVDTRWTHNNDKILANSAVNKVDFMWYNWFCTQTVISHRGSIVLLIPGALGSGFRRNFTDSVTLYVSICHKFKF